MNTVLLTTDIRSETDAVFARQRARQIAALLQFDLHDQTRIATAVSEVARNAFQYAGGGRARFSVHRFSEQSGKQAMFHICISDNGPGIPQSALVSGLPQGDGLGLAATKKLMDDFRIETSSERGTSVEFGKRLPAHAANVTAEQLRSVCEQLASSVSDNPLEEFKHQNQELLQALEALRDRQEELSRLNSELAETNSGVLALYAELEEQAQQLRRSAELKARIYSEMNHEVRTPINAILSLSEILLDGTVGAPLPDQEKPLSFIRKAAQELSELVNDLLDLAKVESGKMIVRADYFDVADLFGALRGMFRPLISSDAVELVVEDALDIPPIFHDEGKISQILRNFISNAIKFTERGEVRVSATLNESFVTFSVTDTGIGISAENQSRLFQEFSQIEVPKAMRDKGTGLGLALSRNLAELMGGSVTVESQLGVGSTFSLRVAAAYGAAPDLGAYDENVRSHEDVEALTILIIDDNEIARYLLSRTLTELDARVVESNNGEDGLACARACNPMLIFLDLVMPGLDGFFVLKQLKRDELTRHIPVVVYTSKHLTPDERESLARDSVVIIRKDDPAHPELVRQTLAKVAGRKPV